MYCERTRLETFKHWPISFIKPDDLACNGFYYLGRGDEVRCAFCQVQIKQWEESDNPATEHKRWAPQCTFLQSKDSVLMKNDFDECGIYKTRTVNYKTTYPSSIKTGLAVLIMLMASCVSLYWKCYTDDDAVV